MTRHRVLIVEDDKATADILADVVAALDCIAVVFDNRRDAIEELSREAICLALLDLEIKNEPDSIRRNEVAGMSVLETVREIYPDHEGVWKLPVLVVSGHAEEVPEAVKIMAAGATFVIQKPFDCGVLSERIQVEFRRSGRADHKACRFMPRRPRGSTITIAIPADQDGSRFIVVVRGERIALPEAQLRLLLRLIAAKLTNKRMHKDDLGGAGVYGYKAPSELQRLLTTKLGKEVVVIMNDRHGHYWLADEVEIGELDSEKLSTISNDLADLASTIAMSRGPKL